MLRRILRWMFGEPKPDECKSSATFKVVDDEPDPYRDFILNEVMRTGGMVGGEIESNGDLSVRYPDGTKKRIPKSDLC